MKKRACTEGQIVYALRQVEAGTAVADICRKLGGNANTFSRGKRSSPGWGSPSCAAGGAPGRAARRPGPRTAPQRAATRPRA